MKCVKCVEGKYIISIPYAEAALQRCSHENTPQKIPPNLQENTHVEVRPQQSRHAALLKSHSDSGAPPQTNPQNTLHKSTPKRLHPLLFKNRN